MRAMERVLLPALCFDLSVDVPHNYVILTVGDRAFFQKAWARTNTM